MITKPTKPDNSLPWFRLAFRPFFLLGSLFSIISILLWSVIFSGHIQLSVYGNGYWWHIHEMLFGFVVAIITGFLLTAVQTWTKVPSIKGKPLMALVSMWLAARVLFLFPQYIPDSIIITVDLLFLPVAAACLARPIIKVKMWRNLIFVPVLLMMTVVNAIMHYAVAFPNSHYLAVSSQAMVMLVILVMCIMGGRVIPMFTANGTQTPRVPAIAWLDKLSIIAVLLVVILSLDLITLPPIINASLFFIAGIANFTRALRWRFWVTLKTPLVWSLHLSYWSIAIGLSMMGIAEVSNIFTKPQAIHALTVGGMGLMILSMISRVSLGHTGRNILVGPAMTSAFCLMVLAFLIRVFAPLMFTNYIYLIQVTALIWALAYGLFVVLYTPILTKPRVDGLPG